MRPFTALNPDTLGAYLRQQPALQAHLGEAGELDVAEVGDGNLNFVYIVRNRAEPGRSLVVKQALPYLRLVGEAWPLTRQRSDHEAHALQAFGALCPQHVPAVLHFDSAQSLIAMQHLSSHVILRRGLIDGITYPHLAEHLSTYLAQTLFHGSDLSLSPAAKKQAAAACSNPELCRITEDLVLSHPFEDHPGNIYSPGLPRAAIERLQHNPQIRVAAAQMKWAFMNQTETLIHGDLHTGSLMVNQNETYVIDPEFAFYGPMGFDLGLLLANLLSAFFSQDWHRVQADQDPAPMQAWLLDQVAQVWNGFVQKFSALWIEHEARSASGFMGALDAPGLALFQADFLQHVFSDALGFAGCELIRRTLGLAKVTEIAGIPDDSARATLEHRILRLAEDLLLRRNELTSITEVIDLARAKRALHL
jgi:5-methylthioribose kinase